MVHALNEFEDFRNEKRKVERLLVRFEHELLFLPKFHPELNPIECLWGAAKVYTYRNCGFTFESLQRMVTPALESVSLNTNQKFSENLMITFMHFRMDTVVLQQIWLLRSTSHIVKFLRQKVPVECH